MNAIMGMTSLAKRDHPKDIVLDYLENIAIAGNQLLSIINDILDFSKVEAGAIQLTPEKYDIHSTINDIVAMIHVRIGEKPIEFIIDDDPSLPIEMIGDETRVKQVIINLLTNSVKFTKSGHIILRISTEQLEADGRCMVKVSVEDTGIGIRSEEMHILFDSFSQVDTRKNRGIEGTGLGLAISKRLIELMDGEVYVKSEYGVGSCFSFHIFQDVCRNKSIEPFSEDFGLRVAVWAKNEKKADIIARKIAKMGAVCDIVDSPENIGTYTHVFFDMTYIESIPAVDFPETKFFALANTNLGGKTDYQGITIIDTPLTSMYLFKILGGISRKRSSGDAYTNDILKLVNARFLVVDDIDINLMIAKEFLQSFGIKVDTATSGKVAIDMIKENDYDMVIMDHMMPEMDGVDATKIIRAMPEEKYQKLPIVALTANVVGDTRQMFVDSGMNDFLSKPMDVEEVKRVLIQWISEEKLR